jgi:hypothetical protein
MRQKRCSELSNHFGHYQITQNKEIEVLLSLL